MMPSSSSARTKYVGEALESSRPVMSTGRPSTGVEPAYSDAEFDPRDRSGKTVSPRIDLTNRGDASTESDADPWARFIADIEADKTPAAAEEVSWPDVGIKTESPAVSPFETASASAVATSDAPPAAPSDPVAIPEAQPAPSANVSATPGLTIMRDTMPPAEPTARAAAPTRPTPREHARTSSVPRSAARRTHRGGSKRGGGGGASTLFEKLRNGWGIAAGIALLPIFGSVLLFGGGESTPNTEAVAQDPGLSGSSTVNVMSAHAFQGAAVPVSSAAGPRTIDDVRASGFTHSELGAAMAALHLAVRTDPATSPVVFVPTIQEQTTGDIAGFLATRQKQYASLAKAAKVPSGQPIIAPTGSMVGWKIPTGWSADAPVTVHLLVQIPNSGKWVDIAPTVVWDTAASDYKLQVSADGNLPSTTTTPDSGYTKFIS